MRWAKLNTGRLPVKQAGPEYGRIKLFLTGSDGHPVTFDGLGSARSFAIAGLPIPWPRPLPTSNTINRIGRAVTGCSPPR